MTSEEYPSDNFSNPIVRIIVERFSAIGGMSKDLYEKLSDLDKGDLTIKGLESLGLPLDGVKFLYQKGKGVLSSEEDAKKLEEKFFHMNPN